jgi:hypothetical protein
MNAKETTMTRTNITKTLTLAAIALLGIGIAPMAKAESRGCSTATLKGAYVHTAKGFEVAPPPIAGPIVGVGTDTFDGNGNVVTKATISLNGTILPLNATGTYSVNPDCTGTYTLPGTTVTFVITDNGNRIEGICIDPGVVLSHTFRRLIAAGGSND